MNSASATPASARDWLVFCLCAQWCGACREWRASFDAAATAHPGLRFAWVDIEDEAHVLGEVDVETFPTLLIAQGDSPRFYGPLQPSQAQLTRLIASLTADVQQRTTFPGEVSTLLKRLRTLAPTLR